MGAGRASYSVGMHMLLLLLLGALGVQDVDALLHKLASESLEERQAAAEALAARGEAALPALERRRDDPDVELRGRVRDVIARVRLEAFSKSLPDDLRAQHAGLATWILQGGEAEHLRAIEALAGVTLRKDLPRAYRLQGRRLKEDVGTYGARAATVVGEIVRRASTPDVREAALFAMRWLYLSGMPEDRAFREGMAALFLADEDEHVRAEAVELAGSTAADAGRALLGARLGDPSGVVRRRIIEHLGRIGDPRVREAAAEKCLSDPDPQVQAAYFELVLQGDRAAAAPVVVKALDGPLFQRACEAAVLFNVREALPRLKESVRKSEPHAYVAVRALGAFGDAEALPEMIALARTPPQAQLKEWYLNAYGLLADPRAREAIEASLNAADARERACALWASSQADPAGAAARLRKILGDAPLNLRETERAFALWALADQGEDVGARLKELAGARDAQISSLASVVEGAPRLTGNLYLLMLNRGRSPAMWERLRGTSVPEPYLEGSLLEVVGRLFKASKVPFGADPRARERAGRLEVRGLTRPNAAVAFARLATQQYEVGFVFEKEGVRMVSIVEARQALGVANGEGK
jgi:HEAT repeat protein